MTDKRAQTMDLKGNQYAKVAERLKLFRTDWSNSKIETDSIEHEGGIVEFRAWCWKNKQEYVEALRDLRDRDLARGTADSDGNAKGTPKGEKDYEKLQTIAVGRALANLGYLASGDVASFEEMEEFEEYKNEQRIKAIADAIKAMDETTTLVDLKNAFVSSELMQVPEVVAAKDRRKAEIQDADQRPEEEKDAAA